MAEASDRTVGVEVTRDAVPASDTIVRAQLHHPEGRRGPRVDVPYPVGPDEGIDCVAQLTGLQQLCRER